MEYRGLPVIVDPTDTWRGTPKGIIAIVVFTFIFMMALAVWVNWDEIKAEFTKAEMYCSMGPVGNCWEIQPTPAEKP